MAADILIDRASVKAGAAADTIKAFARFGVGQDICPAVIEQDKDHFVGAVSLSGLPGAGHDGIVGCYPLAGAIGGQQGPEETQVGERGDHFFETGDDDMGLGK